MDTYKRVAGNLVKAIENSKLSRVEIAEMMDISPAKLEKYLAGKVKPSLDDFANICFILQVSANEMLGLKNPANKRLDKNK